MNYIFNAEVKSEILFENLMVDHLPANIDLTIKNCPCELVELHYRPNTKYRNVVTKKTELDGNVTDMVPNRKMKEVYEAYQKGENCRITAFIHLNFLANSFVFGFSNLRFLQYAISEMGKPPQLNFDHVIHSLTFGPDLKSIASSYIGLLELNGFDTLQGHAVLSQEKNDAESILTKKTETSKGKKKSKEDLENMMHSYYLSVVPNDFSWFMNFILNGFQYTSTSYSKKSDDAGIAFMFELSPITVKYYKKVPNALTFVVEICSIMGGIFMFFRIVDMYMFNFFSGIFKGFQ